MAKSASKDGGSELEERKGDLARRRQSNLEEMK